MGVKIEYTVGGQNWRSKSIFFSKCISDDNASRNMGYNQNKKFENQCVCPSKLNGIHGKLNKEFGSKFCPICHLTRLHA